MSEEEERRVGPNVRKLESLFDENGRLLSGTNVRTIVRIVFNTCPWLRSEDHTMIVEFAQLTLAADAAYKPIDEAFREKKEVSVDERQKMLSEHRQILTRRGRVMDSLGLSPKARKQLGISLEEENGPKDKLS